MTSIIKGFVSQDLKRYKDEAYDLDLTYIIHPNIIAMGFPASGVEGYFRNHIEDIARYLNERHKDHYKVFNLSERIYDEKLFDTKASRVVVMGFPDHHSPPLLLLFRILMKIDEWLKADERNVVVVHCLAGRGRTGTAITSYLLFADICHTIGDALNFYAHQRSATRQGVSQPSQKRSAYYLDAILRYNIYPKPKRLRLNKLIFGPSPRMSSRGGWRPLVYLYNYSNCTEEQLFISEASKEKAQLVPENHYCVFDLSKCNIEMVGDIVLKISHIGGFLTTKHEEVVRLIFHTGMETIKQWGGGWPEPPIKEKDFQTESPLKSPSPSFTPDSSMTFEDDITRNSPQQGSSAIPIPNFLRIASVEVESQHHHHHEKAFELPTISIIESTPNTDQTSSSPLLSTHVTSTTPPTKQLSPSIEKSPSPSNIGQPQSPPKNGPLVQQSSSTTINNNNSHNAHLASSSLVFYKCDLDNAYKMDNSKFSGDFTIRFECTLIEGEDLKDKWDEELYQEFITRYEINKKEQSRRQKQAVIDPTVGSFIVSSSPSPTKQTSHTTEQEPASDWTLLAKLEHFEPM